MKPGDLVTCIEQLEYLKHISNLGMYRLFYPAASAIPRMRKTEIISSGALLFLGLVKNRETGVVWSPHHGVTLIEPAIVDRLVVISSF